MITSAAERPSSMRQLDRQHGGQTLPGVVSGGRNPLFSADTLPIDVGIQCAGEGAPETRQMSTTISLRNIVGVAKGAFLVAVIPLQCELDLDFAAGFLEIEH